MPQAIRELIALEPVRVRAVIGAAIALLVSLGIDLNGSQILEAVDAVLPLIAAVVVFLTTRSQVTPNAKVVVTTEDVENLGPQG